MHNGHGGYGTWYMHMHMHMPMYMPMHMHEQVLKTTVLTVWDRNLQLAFYSMLIYGPCAQLVDRRRLGSATARRLRLLGRTRQGAQGAGLLFALWGSACRRAWAALRSP